MRGGTTYSYDGNGNIITADNISYEYDSQNRMTKALVNDQPVGEYVYDTMNRRVKKTAYGVTTNYVYDQFGNLIAEADSSGSFTREYIYLNSRPLALVDLPLPPSAPPQTISGQVSRGCSTV
jgi:YD repeat-containing protein